MFKGDTIPGLVSTAFGAVALTLTLTGNNMTILASQATGNVPGPGFMPVICSSILILLGLSLIIRGILQNGKVSYFNITPEIKTNIKTTLLVFAGLVAMLAAWKITNQFIICLFVYSVYLNLLFKRSWVFTVISSVAITAFIYCMFMMGFHVTFKV